MLQDADFKPFYTTGEDDEPSSFLYNGLVNGQRFDLGLGYFSSTGFTSLALGFASFIKHGGSMRFIINNSLTTKDKAAILQGMQDDTDEAYEQTLLKDLESLTQTLTKRNAHFFHCLSWLVSSGRLEIIAVVPRKSKVGIVHHKFGIFTDSNGDQAVFNGSLNFSQYALHHNVESIWCEYSWETQGIARRRIDEMIRLFENTWNDRSPAVRIIPIEQVKTAIYQKFGKKPLKELIEMECELAKEVSEHPATSPAYKEKLEEIIKRLNTENSKANEFTVPQPNKWAHQDEAIALFMKHERGVLNMATGTGKTWTALHICKELINNGEIDSIVVSCDGIDLLHQWYKEILKFVMTENLSWAILRQYGGYHESEKFRNNPCFKILLTSRLQLHLGIGKLTSTLGKRTLLIHDEVHRLGSEGNRERLTGFSDLIRFRLGLSATPEREYDDDGTQFILDHVGSIIFEFDLENAIRKGILAPFNYFPVPYELTANDKMRVHNLFKRKAASENAGTPMSDEDFWTELARVYKTAEGKIPAFREFVAAHPELLRNCIIFVETKEYGEQILEIVHTFHTEFHTYFSEDESAILSRFARREIECLVTCHRLSEGIDIQTLQNVILISSARARLETIQRIGRCLRIDPANPDKMAKVIDFIRTTEKEDGKMNTDEEREIFLQHLSTIRPE